MPPRRPRGRYRRSMGLPWRRRSCCAPARRLGCDLALVRRPVGQHRLATKSEFSSSAIPSTSIFWIQASIGVWPSWKSGVKFAHYVGIKYSTLAYWLQSRRRHRDREKLLPKAGTIVFHGGADLASGTGVPQAALTRSIARFKTLAWLEVSVAAGVLARVPGLTATSRRRFGRRPSSQEPWPLSHGEIDPVKIMMELFFDR